MALQKQPININFAQGLDTKTDPNQVPMGKMLALENSVFTRGGLLQKRNGFGNLTQLPVSNLSSLTTLNDNLVAIGDSLYAFSADTNQWLDRGTMPQVDLNVQAMSRSSYNQTGVDATVTSTGLTCATFIDNSLAYYQVVDNVTGQTIVNKTALPSGSTVPRTFLLGQYFIVMFIRNITGTFHVQYIAVPIFNPNSPSGVVDVSSQAKNGTDYYDGVVANNTLYVAFNGSDGGGAIRGFMLNSHLILSSVIVIAAARVGNKIAVTADESSMLPVVWVLAYNGTSHNTYAMAYNQNYLSILAPTLLVNAILNNLSVLATNAVCTFLYETANVYPGTSIISDFISINTITQAGVVGSASVMLRSVGLASKMFYYNTVPYVLVTYGGAFQPTYFLSDLQGNILMRLAPSNGGGYPNAPLASATVVSGLANIPYLIKDFLAALNRTQGSTVPSPIYTQTGVNLAKFSINENQHVMAEIANVLTATGGQVWAYDGVAPVELGFQVFPEDVVATVSTGAGSLTAQQYFYQVTYEWTDATGALHRSAPSIPVGALLTGGQNTVTLQIPTLRLTAKTQVRIVVYRWSTAQQTYYQETSISAPLLSDPTVDTVTYVDLLADSSILGNTILYTTGGVLENIAPPAAAGSTLFKSRYFIIDAEDRNLLWYSKQVLEGTPIEMTDLQTIFVAPSTIASGSGGPVTALSAMDDKLIIFKKDSIYYVTGNGPDATGANNDFSEPTFVTSTVGCANQPSIVFSPQGLMFQSDKGIWLLGRDLSTRYIGAAVEIYNTATVLSGLTVPGTNQVRFSLDSGAVLMYDYYYDQWGTFSNIPTVSSTLYMGLHTYVNSLGQVRQETPGLYLDGTNPVLLKFATAWFKLTNLQGFQRAYFFYLLATYISPHKLNVTVSYDYNPAFTQATMMVPTNFNPAYGSDPIYGDSSPYGGQPANEQWRVFLNQQKCQAIQITVQEIFDASFNTAAGAGLTISGLNFVIGAKLGHPKLPAAQSVG